jgi:hypothetical protein
LYFFKKERPSTQWKDYSRVVIRKTGVVGKPEKFMANVQEWDASEIRPLAITMRFLFGRVVVGRWCEVTNF